jgi:hypothetical protein
MQNPDPRGCVHAVSQSISWSVRSISFDSRIVVCLYEGIVRVRYDSEKTAQVVVEMLLISDRFVWIICCC